MHESYDIEVSDQQECIDIEPEYVINAVRETLAAEEIRSATISIAIVDNPTMHELNRQYLQHDYETDVLSFLLEESEPAVIGAMPRGAGRAIDGEVIVSSDYAADRAPEFGWRPLDELTLYIVHGLLHLCGYDDLTADELPIMRQREQDVFKLLGLQLPVRAADDQGHVESDQVIPSSETGGES